MPEEAMFTRVLVVLTQREGSGALLNTALALTDPDRGWVTLMATPNEPPAWPHAVSLFALPMPTREELHREAESLLAHVAASAEGQRRLATVVRDEELAAAIVARVADASHDLVVVAADALRQRYWPLTSRGTARLLRKTDVPLLIVPCAQSRS